MRKKFTLVASLAFAAALCAGAAAANVTAEAETNWNEFAISATSVRLGDGTKTNPTGLRFKVDCPVDLRAEADAEYYTTLTFTAGTEDYTTDVPATQWRSDASGWNTLLLEIPAAYYTMDVTATATVVLGGQTYTATATSSIAKTAAKLLNGGATDAELNAFVANAVNAITLDKTTAALTVGDSTQLTAEADGYAVVWSSSNPAVATVDNNGNVTAVSVGTAEITATLGNASATCAVTTTYGTAYTYENGSTASPIIKVSNSLTNDFKLATVNGTKVLDATDGIYRNDNGDNIMSTFMFHLNHDYIDWAMAEHDYITFDFYATVPYIGYFRAEGVNLEEGQTSWSIYLCGANAPDTTAKHMKGEAIDGGLYRYSMTLNKNMYKAIQAKGTDYAFRFSLIGSTNTSAAGYMATQVATDVLYFDNVKACDYTTDVIDFEDSNLHEFGFQWFGQAVTSVGIKERVAGDKALYVTGSGANNVGITMEYLEYVFVEQGADYIEWKFYPDYPDAAPSTIAGAVRISCNTGEYNTNLSWKWIAEKGYMICHLYKSSYEKLKTALNGAEPTKLYFQTYVGAGGNADYKAGGYMDDITFGYSLAKDGFTTDVIDFEDGKPTSVLGDFVRASDGAVLSVTNVDQMANGNWALRVATTSAHNPVGVSLDWLHWVFNVQKAQTITYKVYALDGVDTSKAAPNRFSFYTGDGNGWNNDQGDIDKNWSQWFQTYNAEGGYWICEVRAAIYRTYFNTDGTPKKSGWEKIAFSTLYRPDGSNNATQMWIDDITIVK